MSSIKNKKNQVAFLRPDHAFAQTHLNYLHSPLPLVQT